MCDSTQINRPNKPKENKTRKNGENHFEFVLLYSDLASRRSQFDNLLGFKVSKLYFFMEVFKIQPP